MNYRNAKRSNGDVDFDFPTRLLDKDRMISQLAF